MKFFNASAWRNFHSILLSGSSQENVFLSRSFVNLGMDILALPSSLESALTSALQKNYFSLQKFKKKKKEYFYSFLCLVMTSVPFCYKYLFLYDFLFIYLKVSIGVLEKGNLNVRKHPSISALKK